MLALVIRSAPYPPGRSRCDIALLALWDAVGRRRRLRGDRPCGPGGIELGQTDPGEAGKCAKNGGRLLVQSVGHATVEHVRFGRREVGSMIWRPLTEALSMSVEALTMSQAHHELRASCRVRPLYPSYSRPIEEGRQRRHTIQREGGREGESRVLLWQKLLDLESSCRAWGVVENPNQPDSTGRHHGDGVLPSLTKPEQDEHCWPDRM